jgi:hypothetical protein
LGKVKLLEDALRQETYTLNRLQDAQQQMATTFNEALELGVRKSVSTVAVFGW